MDQLDLDYIRELLSICKEAGLVHFKHADLSFAFGGGEDEEDDEDDGQVVSGIGFEAQGVGDDDDEEDLDSPASMHKRAYRSNMPTLFPKKSE